LRGINVSITRKTGKFGVSATGKMGKVVVSATGKMGKVGVSATGKIKRDVAINKNSKLLLRVNVGE